MRRPPLASRHALIDKASACLLRFLLASLVGTAPDALPHRLVENFQCKAQWAALKSFGRPRCVALSVLPPATAPRAPGDVGIRLDPRVAREDSRC